MIDSILTFDVWGSYAHFKKIYVTTSALSNAIPSKTSIYGLVGAILGLERNDNQYLKSFEEGKCKLAIKLNNSVSYIRLNTNLSEEPGPIKKNRKPTLMEYVNKPSYRIYFWHDDKELMNELAERLKCINTHFTPVLGLAHCLANLKFQGIFKVKEKTDSALIHSVLSKDKLIKFDEDYWSDNEIHLEEQSMYPLEMNTDREVTKRTSVLYDIQAKPIKCEARSFMSVQDSDSSNIMLL